MKLKKILALLFAVIISGSLLLPILKKEAFKTDGLFTSLGIDFGLLPERLTKEKAESFPIASENLSYDKRRQLAIDFYDLQLSFQWRPGTDITDYPVTRAGSSKELITNCLYSGIPYQSLGAGNIYRWLEYYDENTAVMDLKKAFEENGGYGDGAAVQDVKELSDGTLYKKYLSFMTFFNQCSVSSYWAWGRVVNSARFGWTYDVNVRNGFIPVGLYSYPRMTVIDQFAQITDHNPDGYTVSHIFSDWEEYNPDKTVYDCYAQAKPADILAKNGHIVMIRTVNTVKGSDGTIDPQQSTVTVLEQCEAWSYKDTLHGKNHFTQGRNSYTYTFEELFAQQYLPWTVAEFLDPDDPQDKKHLDFYESVILPLNHHRDSYTLFNFTDEELREMTGIDIEKAVIFTTLKDDADSITAEEFSSFALGSNYGISDIFVTVKDKNGKELKKNVFRALDSRTREVSIQMGNATHKTDEEGNRLTLADGILPLATGENTLEISVQLSTGEKLTAFSGKLMP